MVRGPRGWGCLAEADLHLQQQSADRAGWHRLEWGQGRRAQEKALTDRRGRNEGSDPPERGNESEKGST